MTARITVAAVRLPTPSMAQLAEPGTGWRRRRTITGTSQKIRCAPFASPGPSSRTAPGQLSAGSGPGTGDPVSFCRPAAWRCGTKLRCQRSDDGTAPRVQFPQARTTQYRCRRCRYDRSVLRSSAQIPVGVADAAVACAIVRFQRETVDSRNWSSTAPLHLRRNQRFRPEFHHVP